MTSWFSDEDMWRVFYDCMFDANQFRQARQDCANLCSLINQPITTGLDLSCGPGRHLLGFADQDIQMTGVDLSGFLLNQAANHIESEGVDADLVLSDLLDYQPRHSFDLITNLFSSFGYYDDPKDNQLLLNKIHQWLNPSGYFVLDVFSKEQAAMHIEPVHCTEYDNGDIRFERPLLTDHLSVYSNEWILVRGDKAYRWSYQHYVYSAVELEDMLQQAGFTAIDIYGSFSGDDYDMDAERLVVVAQK